MDLKKASPFQQTLLDLQQAFQEWDKIPDHVESELEKFKKKTRELLVKLNEQIKALDL